MNFEKMVEEKLDKLLSLTVKTETRLDEHCQKFDDYCQSMEPVKKDFHDREAVKNNWKDNLKTLSLALGVVLALIAIYAKVSGSI